MAPACRIWSSTGRRSPVGGRLYRAFTRQQWAALRAHTPLTLSTTELAQLRGVNEVVSLEEVVDVFLPLSRLLNLHISARYQFRGSKASSWIDHPPLSPSSSDWRGALRLEKAHLHACSALSLPDGPSTRTWVLSLPTVFCIQIGSWKRADSCIARGFLKATICAA